MSWLGGLSLCGGREKGVEKRGGGQRARTLFKQKPNPSNLVFIIIFMFVESIIRFSLTIIFSRSFSQDSAVTRVRGVTRLI